MAPRDVDESNAPEVWHKLYGKKGGKKRPSLRVGDRVRLNKKRRPFKKGYLPGWTEVFIVTEVRRDGSVPTYRVSE